MSQYELESRWVTTEGIPGVTHRFGDLVRIKSGEYSGQSAEVIALIALEPQPVYLVILPPNEKSVVLLQSELESAKTNTGRKLIIHKLGAAP